MKNDQPRKTAIPPKEEVEKEAHVIPAGTEQETGLSRFIRTPDENPEEIKDARLNNKDEVDPTVPDEKSNTTEKP